MYRIFVSVNLLITYTVSTGAVELSAKINGAVHFYLPSFRDCGEYSLTDPRKHDVIKIKNASHAEVNDVYQYRSNYHVLDNGTVLFTLHYLTPNNDDGTFLVTSSKCPPVIFSLKVITEHSDEGPAYWSAWGPWSACSSSCDSGYKTRTRNCSDGSRCYHGKGIESEPCLNSPCPTQAPMFGKWNDWAQWSACSTPCETGTRKRQRSCLGEVCDGPYIEQQRCDESTCSRENGVSTSQTGVSWSTWSDWSECSRTCETGTRSRDRDCLDERRRSVQNEFCVGESTERIRCNHGSCVAVQGVGSNVQTGSHSEPVLSLPLSVVIGTGASLVVLILLIVIIVLLVRLKKRGRRDRNLDEHNTNTGGAMNNQIRKKKQFNNDVSVDRVTSSHTYAEIDDDSEFDTDFDQLTIDNTYTAMPRSPRHSVDHGRPSSARYLNIPDPNQKVKGGNGGRLQYKENDARVDVDRQKCIYYNSNNINRRQFPSDSAGYAVPLGALR